MPARTRRNASLSALSALILLTTSAHGAFAQRQQAAAEIIIPPPGNINLFINESQEMAVRVQGTPAPVVFNGKSLVPEGMTVAWSATDGCFIETFSPTTTYLAAGEAGNRSIDWFARAVSLDSRHDLSPAAIPATAPAAARGIKTNVGESHFLTDSIRTDLHEALAAPDRDSRVNALRAAITRHPNDPLDIVLEFQVATLVGQNPDPDHHQEVDQQESLAALGHILQTYDHHAYYQPLQSGETCSPQLMMPRAAIMAASIYNGWYRQPETARSLARRAMDDLDWTFRTRTAEWLNAPRPAARAHRGTHAGTDRPLPPIPHRGSRLNHENNDPRRPNEAPPITPPHHLCTSRGLKAAQERNTRARLAQISAQQSTTTDSPA